jgi:hypothetical protein
MELDIEKEAINWRWKKLNEIPINPIEPFGLCDTIDFFIWGKQSWEQKAICSSMKIKEEIIRGIKWKNKEKNN